MSCKPSESLLVLTLDSTIAYKRCLAGDDAAHTSKPFFLVANSSLSATDIISRPTSVCVHWIGLVATSSSAPPAVFVSKGYS